MMPMSDSPLDLSKLLQSFGVTAPDVSDAVEEAVLGVCETSGIGDPVVIQRWGRVIVVCSPAEAERAVRVKDTILEAAQAAGDVSEVTIRVDPSRRRTW